MTLVELNHLRLGSTRPAGVSRLWYDAALVISPWAFLCAFPSLNMFKVLTFFALWKAKSVR